MRQTKEENKTVELSKAKKLALINDTYHRIVRATQSQHYADRYFDKILQEERDHRKWGPSRQCGISVNVGARLFYVDYLIKAIDPKIKKPKAEQLIWMKSSVFYAYGVLNEHRKEIKKVLTPALRKLWKENIDYAKLMEV